MIWIVYGAEFLQEGHAWLESLLYNYSCLSWRKEETQLQDLIFRTSRMAQQIKMLAAKPEDPSSIPGSHIREREMWLLQVVLRQSIYTMAYLYPLPHDNKKSNKEENKTFIGDGSSKGRNRSEGWGMNDRGVECLWMTKWVDLNSHTVFHGSHQSLVSPPWLVGWWVPVTLVRSNTLN